MPVRQASPEDFVRAWQSSGSITEVARKLGMSVNAVWMRATRYRAKGVRLAFEHVRDNRQLDVDALNRLAREAGQ